jgi:hypothetical protein
MYTIDRPSAAFEYEWKDSRIRAIKIFELCVVNGMEAKSGDYLIFCPNGIQRVLTDEEFKSRYIHTKEAKRLILQNQIKILNVELENLTRGD